MAKFLMLGKYSEKALEGISGERTKEATGLIEKSGGKVDAMFALLGGYDLAFIVDFQGVQEAMKTSIALTKLTNVSFTTFPAVTVKEFDKMIG
ncbi:MAG: GYD domain-containing protein [bacterium]